MDRIRDCQLPTTLSNAFTLAANKAALIALNEKPRCSFPAALVAYSDEATRRHRSSPFHERLSGKGPRPVCFTHAQSAASGLSKVQAIIEHSTANDDSVGAQHQDDISVER